MADGKNLAEVRNLEQVGVRLDAVAGPDVAIDDAARERRAVARPRRRVAELQALDFDEGVALLDAVALRNTDPCHSTRDATGDRAGAIRERRDLADHGQRRLHRTDLGFDELEAEIRACLPRNLDDRAGSRPGRRCPRGVVVTLVCDCGHGDRRSQRSDEAEQECANHHGRFSSGAGIVRRRGLAAAAVSRSTSAWRSSPSVSARRSTASASCCSACTSMVMATRPWR